MKLTTGYEGIQEFIIWCREQRIALTHIKRGDFEIYFEDLALRDEHVKIAWQKDSK